MNIAEKIAVSGASVLFLLLLWAASPPKTAGQKTFLFFATGGRSAVLFRPLLTLSIIAVNAAIWMG